MSGMTDEDRGESPGGETSKGRATEGSNIGAWSGAGEFLGRAALAREGAGALEDYAYCSVSRGTAERGVRFTLHAFDGGYRVLVEDWGNGEDRSLWLAPAEEEEESYLGLFSEEEIRERFPYLLAALEIPDGVGLREGGAP